MCFTVLYSAGSRLEHKFLVQKIVKYKREPPYSWRCCYRSSVRCYFIICCYQNWGIRIFWRRWLFRLRTELSFLIWCQTFPFQPYLLKLLFSYRLSMTDLNKISFSPLPRRKILLLEHFQFVMIVFFPILALKMPENPFSVSHFLLFSSYRTGEQ